MKVLLVKDRNVLGTKWVLNFANQLVKRGYEVHLVSDSLTKAGNREDSALSKSVHYTNLSHSLLSKLIPAPLKFKKFISKTKPDVIICYFPKDLYNVAVLGRPKAPIIMMMHNPPNEVFDKWQKSPIKKALYKSLMNKIAVLQVLMHNFAALADKYYDFKKIVVIPNQVIQIPLKDRRDLSKETHKITHIAQIAEQYKRQHLTLEAFAKVAKDFPKWTLNFYGKVKKGKHEKYYRRLLLRVKELGLQNRVKFNGYCNHIDKVYQQADINCTPSFSEGFGYGMADGLAYGVPGLGFASALGVNELIINEKTGFLVKDVDDYADKMRALMKDKALRIKMGKAAAKDMQRYAPKVVIDAWDKLIKETVANDK